MISNADTLFMFQPLFVIFNTTNIKASTNTDIVENSMTRLTSKTELYKVISYS